MAARSVNYYLIKLVRLSGWFLFILMILYIITGYALCGEMGVERLIEPEQALKVHQLFDVPLVVLFLAHSLTSIYFAMRRWGWIRTRRRA